MAGIYEVELNQLLEDLLSKGTLPDPIMYQYYKGLANNTIILHEEIPAI